jgi:predicted neuraminidase
MTWKMVRASLSCWFSVFLTFFGHPIGQASGQEMIKTQSGYVNGELIFPLDRKPTPQCHASTIAAPGERLVAAWFGGTEERNPDVGIWVSHRQGNAWSPPAEVTDGRQPDGQRFPTWNPVLFQPKKGPLLLFYKVGPSPSEWWGMLTTSDDRGTSWSTPVRLPDGILGPVKDKPVQLEDGTLLCPSSTEENGWQIHFEWTEDLGKTWQRSESVKDDKGLGAIQPTILVHSEGVLQLLCRTRAGVIAESWSRDSGRTWSPLQGTVLPNPNSGIDAVTLSDGRYLLVYNHAEGKGWGPRTPLNVAISGDGKSWTPVLVLENEPGEYSYPSVIQTKDGLVHIVYTYRRQSIKHVVLDPSRLATK